MTPDEVADFAATLPGCKKKGTATRPAWYVDNRLVARLEDPTTLTIRMSFEDRERFVAEFPDTFGVPPAMERHLKVQAVLDQGHDDVVRTAVRSAYDLQRRR